MQAAAGVMVVDDMHTPFLLARHPDLPRRGNVVCSLRRWRRLIDTSPPLPASSMAWSRCVDGRQSTHSSERRVRR